MPSLVGSEMCIRDRSQDIVPEEGGDTQTPETQTSEEQAPEGGDLDGDAQTLEGGNEPVPGSTPEETPVVE